MCQAKVIVLIANWGDARLAIKTKLKNFDKLEGKSIDLNKICVIDVLQVCGNVRKATGMEQTRARKIKLDGKITSSKSKH